MLNLLFCALCTGVALDRTRAILDSYATRCGNDTWTAHMTKEGLSILRSELMRTATRNTAISCVSLDGRGNNLMWLVGKRKKFLRNGACSVASGAHHVATITRPFERMLQMRRLGAFAAIRHDMGKANLFMANKLQKGLHEPDPVRHEILSLLLTDEMLREKDSSFTDVFGRAAARASKLTEESEFVAYPTTERDISRWVLATHHRLPKGSIGCAYYANHLTASTAKETALGLTCAGNLLVDEELVQSLTKSAAAKEEESNLDQPTIEGLFMWSRLSMMLGDHHASSKTLPEGVTGILANSNQPGRPAQDLAKHLLATEKFADKAAWVLHHLEPRLPALYPEDRSEIMKPSPVKMAAAYGWQNPAVTAARQLTKSADYSRSGTFVVLCASTGSGKTRAGTKIMSVLAGERMRLTTLLGLRSLTLQTGDSYADEASIPRENLAVLIGSREVRNLHESEKKRKDREKTNDADVYVETTVASGISADLPGIVETQIRSDDDRRMLSSPVLVCTIDYLMGGADWRKSGHILPQLRLMTSDIILDEIDGYNLEDYAAIGRLCYLVGLFGKRLMLSSATAMPEIVAPLYKAYEAGWKAYSAITGCSSNVYSLFVADSVQPVMISAAANLFVDEGQEHWFKPRYQAFTASVASASQSMACLRRGYVASITSLPELIDGIENLHDQNSMQAEEFPEVTVSAGLIRIARVADTVAISRALVRLAPEILEKKGIFIKVLSYHSNLPLAVRAWVESYLDSLLKRKPGKTDPVAINSISEEARNSGASKAVILVVATPVEEVGRDHDFDWAIIEPSSSRSIVQCAGRVNRHRRAAIDAEHFNIAVMKQNLRDQEGRERSFWGPGFESKTYVFPSHDISIIAPQLVERPDAEACLADDVTDNLPQWERQIIEDTLENSLTVSFTDCLSAKLTDEHFDNHGFRSGEKPVEVFYSYPEKKWKDTETGVALQFEPVSVFPNAHWVIDMKDGLANIVSDVAGKLGLDHMDESFSKKYMRVGLAEYYYDKVGVTKTHPIIGIFKENFKTILK
jgi:CRISPR-associated endonuclease/helicase Cas3